MISQKILDLGIQAKKASMEFSCISGDIKNLALEKLKKNLRNCNKELININKKDIEKANLSNLSSAMIDRLTLNNERIDSMIKSIEDIIKLDDPVGKIINQWKRPNGLNIKKISIPLGVIGIIYESRPNVTIDASAIAIKSGNAVILKGGKDSFHSSNKLFDIIKNSFEEVGLPKNIVQMIKSTDRSIVEELLKLDKYIDVIIPRGGKGLIKTIKEKSSIPLIKHLDGICHVFVDKNANLKKAQEIIFNSKMRRTGICGATETLLIDQTHIKDVLKIIEPLVISGCEIRGDDYIASLNTNFLKATEEDWSTEYLEAIISVKIVKNLGDAIDHINKYSSGHTETIVTESNESFENFYQKIDSAIILKNASTQFADGGEFGLGAEIGISTDKLHVRGPVGAQHLTSYKYVIEGNGQVRT